MSAKDATQEYLTAKADFDDAAHRLIELGQVISRVGRALMSSPPNLTVTDTAPPANLAYGQSVYLGAEDWPCSDRLKDALAAYEQARLNAERLYRALPSEVQDNVHAPATR